MERVTPVAPHRPPRWSALLAPVAFVLASTGCQRAGGPNILLYVVDTLRADAVGAYGDTAMHTPAADRLAAEGIRFARAYANASWTRPSMATLLTGTYPRTHGAIGRQDALRSGLPTLATELRARGYHTAAVFANPNVGAAFGFAEGFDDFIPLYPPRLGHGQTLPQEQIGTAVNVVNRAIDWLRAHRRQPFFLLVFSVDPHAPYEPPPPYNTMYDAEYTGHIDGSMESVFALLAGAAMGTPPPARDVQHLRALYHGEVTFNDAHLARLLGELDDQHLTDNTLVVFTSDHGEEFYEHGHGDHGHSLYEELIHIPLIMRWPRVTARGTVYPDAVQLADLYPTLLHLAGAPAPGGPGRDLAAIVRGTRDASVPSLVYAEEKLDQHDLQALILGQRKLIYDAARAQPLAFDLARDPGELQPSPGMPPQDLIMRIADIQAHNRPPQGAAARAVRPTELPEAARQAMEALGYGEHTKRP